MTILNGKAQQFIDEVLRLAPRMAAFDCDGTLWAGDSGEGFFYWEMERGLVSKEIEAWARPRYADYRAGKVDEDTMCGEMVTMNRGLKEADLIRAAEEYFAERCAKSIFSDMHELLQRLQAAGCEIWVVSSTNEWVIRASTRYLSISPDHVIAACAASEDGRCSSRLLMVPTDEGKAVALRERFPDGAIDAAFGNTVHDVAMLELARHAFAISPDAGLESIAREHGWTVYHPEGDTTR